MIPVTSLQTGQTRPLWFVAAFVHLSFSFRSLDLVPPRVLVCQHDDPRGYQADFNGRCVVFKMYTGVYHRFIVSMGTRRAAWRRSQGCDCVARELKWKINLCPWILRWICGRGYILAWDFWLRAAGCPDRSVLPCLLFMKRKPGFKKIA